MLFTKPKCIKPGSVVGVFSPSDATERKLVEEGRKIIESWGLKVKLGQYTFANQNDFQAGSLAQRMHDMHQICEDPEVDIIWASSGGYASLDSIDFFMKNIADDIIKGRKLLIGYSDITTFECGLFARNHVSLHGPQLGGLAYWSERSLLWLQQILFTGKVPDVGEETELIEEEITVKTELSPVLKSNKEIRGHFLAANFSTLINTFGSNYDPIIAGDFDIILALEELETGEDEIRRLAEVLANHVKSSRIKGIVLGRFTDIKEESYATWSKKNTIEDIFRKHLGERLDIPIFHNIEWGHAHNEKKMFETIGKTPTFYALPNGIHAKIDKTDGGNYRLHFTENLLE